MSNDDGIDFKTVLIVGNGFDINLGLKTSYNDYIQSRFFKNGKYGVPFLEHLEKLFYVNNWIDIELELKKYANILDNEDVNMPFRRQHDILCSSLKSYLQSLDYNFINELSDAIRLFDNFEDKSVFVMNFNYTDTIKLVCRNLFPKPLIYEIKMHGSFQKGIIFGIEDNADIPEKYIFLKKSTHPIFKPINFSERLSIAEEIIFFGYSLGESDHMYFKDFFKEQSTKETVRKRMKIKIYYFGEDSYFQMHAQLDKLTNKNITGLKQLNDVSFINLKRE